MKSAPLRFAAAVLAASIASIASCDKKSPIEPTDCTATLTTAAFSFPPAGGSGSTAVGIADGCQWTAQAQAPWLTITSGSSGNGAGTVSFTAAENTAESARSGSLAIAGLTATVTQAGREPEPTCTYTVTPESATIDKDGGTGAISVAAPDGCAWTSSSNADWVVIISGASGSGSGVITYSATPNRVAAERTAVLSITDRTVRLTQNPDLGACEYSVAPSDIDACMPSIELTTTLTTQDVCPWTATPNVSWITVLGGESGVGPGPVRFRISENYDAPRQGTVMVRWPTPTEGQNVQVGQAGCIYAVSPNAFVVGAPGGTFSVDVFQQSTRPDSCGGPQQDACVWSATSDVDWITITTPMPRKGDDRIAFTVAPNPTHASRTGFVRVKDQIVEVSQGR